MKIKLPQLIQKGLSIRLAILFAFIASFSVPTWSQVSIFSEDFEAASGAQNIAAPYLGWQTGQFTTNPATIDNYFWVFDNTRCNVIAGTHSMAVSINTPATTGTMPQYRTNRRASTLVYYTTPIDATTYTNLTLDFKWICEGEVGTDYGRVLYSFDGATWAALPGIYQGQATVQNVTNLDLSVLDGQTFYLGFGWNNDQNGGVFPGFIIDDIDVKGIQQTPCTTPNPPTAISLVATGNSINGTFTAAAPAPSGYLVVVSTSATPPSPTNGLPYTIGDPVGAGYTVVDTDANTTFTAGGLSPSTTYYIYVFSYNTGCLGGPQYSATSLSGSATTTNSTYCTPTTSNSTSFKYINDVQFIGTLNDVSNFGNTYFQPNTGTCVLSGSSNGYQDWSCRPKSIQAQGEGVNIYVGSSTGRGRYKAWVDWNKDGVFDNNLANGELVYDSGGILTTTTTFGFVIPTNQPIGDYRIRIRFHAATNNAGAELGGAYNFTPCQSFGSGGGVRHYGEAEDYLFTVVTSCPAKITSITEGATCGSGPVTLEATGTGTTEYRWYAAETGGTPVAITATGTWAPILSATTTYWVTAYNGSCESLVRTKIVATVNPITELSITPEFPSVCGEDDIIEISATGDTEIAYLIDEDFEDAAQPTGVFSVINLINNGGATNAITQWQKRTSPFVANQLVWKPAMSSGIAGNHFLSATSDVAPASGYVYTSLESPELDSSTFTDLTLNFDMYFSKYLTGLDPDYVLIYASRDGGTNWELVQAYVDDVGYGTDFSNLTIDMIDFIDEPNLKISIDYYAIWADGAAVDNIQLFGSRPLNPSFSWIGTVDAYTAATALPGQEYTPNTEIGTVYVKPTLAQLELDSFTFTAIATLTNGCTVSKDITITNKTKVWQDGSSSDWFNANNWKPFGVPDATNCVIIPDQTTDPIIIGTGDGDAYNLLVKNGGELLVQAGGTITVVDAVTVDTGGLLELEGVQYDTAQLIQVNDVANSGAIKLDREANVRRQDYVYWSSPVENYAITNIFNTGLIFEWIPTIGANPGQHGDWTGFSGTMAEGKGYIVRGPTGNGNTNDTASWNTITFDGVPNNGTVVRPINRGTFTGTITQGAGQTTITAQDDNWNLVGNPYPSAIDALVFTDANPDIQGTIYLWTHGTQIQYGVESPFYGTYLYNYDATDYLEYNTSGANPPGYVFNGFIGSGQAFFVEMLDAAGNAGNGYSSSITFDNTMRNRTHGNDQFFRGSRNRDGLERHRIWLDMVNPSGRTNTTLLAYAEGATNDVDRLYDASIIASNGKNLYSMIADKGYIIQGRALPFDTLDEVPLGFIADEVGQYTIAINTVDGVFEDSEQTIYLKDLELGLIHDIKAAPYYFTVNETGTFNNRFVVVYVNNALSIDDINALSGLVITAPNSDYIKITSSSDLIDTITVHDLLGRVLVSKKGVNSSEYVIDHLNRNSGVLMVTVTLTNRQQKIQKVVIKS